MDNFVENLNSKNSKSKLLGILITNIFILFILKLLILTSTIKTILSPKEGWQVLAQVVEEG